MIRPITCVGFVLACASGFYLYQTKHRVTVIDHEIADAVHQTGVIRKQIPILAAESGPAQCAGSNTATR